MISEFLDFIRIRICTTIAFIAMSGYLLFNPPDLNLLYVALSPFFIFAGGYAYNNITDKREDSINRKGINPIVESEGNYLIVFLCLFVGIVFSLPLSFYSILDAFLILLVSISYSFFRLKKYFLVKNVYTGFALPLAFLLGAFNGPVVTNEILQYYLLLSFFIFIGSVVSDLRDLEGDRKTGIKTLPVYLGFGRARKLTYFMLLVCIVLFLMLPRFLILLPFTLFVIFFLHKNRVSSAHSLGGVSLIALTLWLVI